MDSTSNPNSFLSALALPGPSTRSPLPKGFRPIAPERRPIHNMSIAELKNLHAQNIKNLAEDSNPSTSSYIPRLRAEQVVIESRLLDLEGIPSLGHNLQRAHIDADEDVEMGVAEESASPLPPMIEAKRRALARFAPKTPSGQRAPFTWEEAEAIQRRAVAAEKDRQRRAEERKARRPTMPKAEDQLDRKEFEARMWAFVNYKPTESDEEDDEDDENEDPANWFVDDQEDGVKGQDIVEPDAEDWADIIRMDQSKVLYNTIYELREDD